MLCHQLESSIATVPGRIMAQPCSPTKRVYAIVSSASSLRRTMSDSLGHAKVLSVKVLVVPIEIVGSSARAGNAGVVIMATRITAAIFPVCFVLISVPPNDLGHGLFPRGFWVFLKVIFHLFLKIIRDGDSIGRHLFDRALDRFPVSDNSRKPLRPNTEFPSWLKAAVLYSKVDGATPTASNLAARWLRPITNWSRDNRDAPTASMRAFGSGKGTEIPRRSPEPS